MFEKGEERITMELDMLKIVRNLKNLRIFMRKFNSDTVEGKLKKISILHDQINVIDLEHSEGDCEAECGSADAGNNSDHDINVQDSNEGPAKEGSN